MFGARYGAAVCLALGISDLVWLNGSLAPRLVPPAHASEPDRSAPERVRSEPAPSQDIPTPARPSNPAPATRSTRWILTLSPRGAGPADLGVICAEVRDALARDVEAIVVASVPAGQGGAAADRRLVARLAEVLGPEGIPWSRVRVEASLRRDRSIELELGRIGE
ncbi:hypothetical protein L6R52_03050 [Myxococcota bacterium]|nr:hypothetical protein [Myxococcota bacterium]